MRSWAAGDGGRDSFGDRWPRDQTRGAGMTSGPSGGRPVALPCRSTSGNKENSVRTRHVMLLLAGLLLRSEEHTSELQSLMRISYAVFCLKKKTKTNEPFIYTKDITHNP